MLPLKRLKINYLLSASITTIVVEVTGMADAVAGVAVADLGVAVVDLGAAAVVAVDLTFSGGDHRE